MNKKVKKWVVSLSTTALIAAGSYTIGKFNPEKGYPVVKNSYLDTVPKSDTMWIADSIQLVEFSKNLGSYRLGGGK